MSYGRLSSRILMRSAWSIQMGAKNLFTRTECACSVRVVLFALSLGGIAVVGRLYGQNKSQPNVVRTTRCTPEKGRISYMIWWFLRSPPRCYRIHSNELLFVWTGAKYELQSGGIEFKLFCNINNHGNDKFYKVILKLFWNVTLFECFAEPALQ